MTNKTKSMLILIGSSLLTSIPVALWQDDQIGNGDNSFAVFFLIPFGIVITLPLILLSKFIYKRISKSLNIEVLDKKYFWILIIINIIGANIMIINYFLFIIFVGFPDTL